MKRKEGKSNSRAALLISQGVCRRSGEKVGEGSVYRVVSAATMEYHFRCEGDAGTLHTSHEGASDSNNARSADDNNDTATRRYCHANRETSMGKVACWFVNFPTITLKETESP